MLTPDRAGGPDGPFEYEGAERAERKGNNFLILWKRADGYEIEYRWTKDRKSVHDVWGQAFHHYGNFKSFGKTKSLFDNKRIVIL